MGAYILYAGLGLERIDALGLATKLVELAAIGLLWLPDDPRRLHLRMQGQEVLPRRMQPRI